MPQTCRYVFLTKLVFAFPNCEKNLYIIDPFSIYIWHDCRHIDRQIKMYVAAWRPSVVLWHYRVHWEEMMSQPIFKQRPPVGITCWESNSFIYIMATVSDNKTLIHQRYVVFVWYECSFNLLYLFYEKCELSIQETYPHVENYDCFSLNRKPVTCAGIHTQSKAQSI